MLCTQVIRDFWFVFERFFMLTGKMTNTKWTNRLIYWFINLLAELSKDMQVSNKINLLLCGNGNGKQRKKSMIDKLKIDSFEVKLVQKFYWFRFDDNLTGSVIVTVWLSTVLLTWIFAKKFIFSNWDFCRNSQLIIFGHIWLVYLTKTDFTEQNNQLSSTYSQSELFQIERQRRYNCKRLFYV